VVYSKTKRRTDRKKERKGGRKQTTKKEKRDREREETIKRGEGKRGKRKTEKTGERKKEGLNHLLDCNMKYGFDTFLVYHSLTP